MRVYVATDDVEIRQQTSTNKNKVAVFRCVRGVLKVKGWLVATTKTILTVCMPTTIKFVRFSWGDDTCLTVCTGHASTSFACRLLIFLKARDSGQRTAMLDQGDGHELVLDRRPRQNIGTGRTAVQRTHNGFYCFSPLASSIRGVSRILPPLASLL